ncbi:Neur-chan-LBD domain-containing protein [Aphelenchoides bicaudatus]|nr:Neur-chan-LBD domain-containing protein [Aphelenchoides bicaudatus]
MADWVYDLSKVNLSNGAYSRTSSTVRLSSNPFAGEQKRHFGGWEIIGHYESICFFGQNGCEKKYPSTQPRYLLEHYWSLIEFGIEFKRHAPYFFVTIQLPLVVSSIFALFAFWTESMNVSIGVCLAAMLLECFTGYSLLKMLPPSTSQAPKIVCGYSYTVLVGLLILTIHVGLIFAQNVLPENFELDLRFAAWTEYFRQKMAFKKEGFKFNSFDPDSLLETGSAKSQVDDEQIQDPQQTQQHSLNMNPNFEFNENEEKLIEMDPVDVQPENVLSSKSSSDASLVNHADSQVLLDIDDEPSTSATSIIHLDDREEDETEPDANEVKPKDKLSTKETKTTKLEQELQTLRRVAFFVVAFIQLLIIIIFI